jgi:N-acetyl-gamma-glutamyl-phosphate reductase
MPLSVAVAGASGYAGGEVLRLLAAHPELRVTTVTAHRNAGQLLGDVQPHLRSLAGMMLQETTPEVLAGADVVVLALPHGESGAITARLPDDVVVIDCGADHRLTDPAAWERFYGGDFFGAWDYGLPELLIDGGAGKQRETLAGSTRIAAPGCNASAVTLALAPGIAAGVIASRDLVAVLAVGTSGAGKSLRTDLLASEIAGSASAYQVGGVHRHIPEIQQNLVAAGAVDPTLSFTPVLVPMSRGILATATAPLAPGVSAADVRDAYASAYSGEPFVQLLPAGAFPRSGDTTGANTALIGIAVDEAANRLVAVCAIDNLVKGTAGAAIQSANIALGFEETTALPLNGVAP